jgi:hypothetical protein
MTHMDFDDGAASRMLASLPDYEPDRQCTRRIRERCHAAVLAGRSDAKARPFRVEDRPWRLGFEFAAIAAVCAVYLAEVARHALVLYRL